MTAMWKVLDNVSALTVCEIFKLVLNLVFVQGFADAGDILVDPFSISAWTEIDGTASEQQNGNAGMKELRRSRMTSEERREHNRRLLERRDIGQARHFTNS